MHVQHVLPPSKISKMAKNNCHPNTLRSSNLDQGSVGLLESDPITRHVFVLQVLLANPYLSLLNMESQAGGQHLVDNNSLFKSRSSLSNQIAWRLENSSFCKHPQKRYTLFWTVFVPHDSNNWNSSTSHPGPSTMAFSYTQSFQKIWNSGCFDGLF